MNVGICLVELKTPENIGFIARVMKNFGFGRLYLYNCELNEMSYITASHAHDILNKAVTVKDLHSFLSDKNLIIGTTGVTGINEERYLRKPIFYPHELREHLKGKSANAIILFGRENYGLLNEELELCHMLVTIPSSPEYPVLNVSHAAAIILYELNKDRFMIEEKCYATSEDIERIVELFEELMIETRYPPHRIPRSLLMLRRVAGKSLMTKNEYTTYLGIIRKIKIYLDELRKERQKNDESLKK